VPQAVFTLHKHRDASTDSREVWFPVQTKRHNTQLAVSRSLQVLTISQDPVTLHCLPTGQPYMLPLPSWALDCSTLDDKGTTILGNIGTTCPVTQHHTAQNLNPCNVPCFTEPKTTLLCSQIPHNGLHSKPAESILNQQRLYSHVAMCWGSISCMCKRFLSSPNGRSSYGAYPASYCVIIKASFRRGKTAGT
jgi:hypothetical protein